NWDEPLIPRSHFEAGCGVCHSHLPLPDAELAAQGRGLFAARGCDSCHVVDGRAGDAKVDLSRVGLRGYRNNWYREHLHAAELATDIRFTRAAMRMVASDGPALAAYLQTLVGAPRLMAGKLLADRLGCRGCHRIGGVGGDDGPVLADVGGRRASEIDFTRVRGAHTQQSWLRSLLSAPSTLNPQSRMPRPDLRAQQIELLTTYLLSLRTREIPVEYWPRDRVRGLRLAEHEFAPEGQALFARFCSACHGRRGEGSELPGDGGVLVPAVGGAAFLAIAQDAFVARTVTQGRAAHRMPAWGSSDTGLNVEEVASVVRYLRGLEPQPPALTQVMASPLDLAAGKGLFAQRCAPCHGSRAEGTAIGPPLAAADNLARASAPSLFATLSHGIDDTAMGSFRTLSAAQLRDVIGAAQALEPVSQRRADWRPTPGDPERGRSLFARHCDRCHGSKPDAARAPSIEDAHFVSSATDGFLTASIVRRHDGPRADLKLTAADVADVVAYLRGRALSAGLRPAATPPVVAPELR
ncbi:MAG TPA: c-type cytochrome, partial [Polyangiales bacterium]